MKKTKFLLKFAALLILAAVIWFVSATAYYTAGYIRQDYLEAEHKEAMQEACLMIVPDNLSSYEFCMTVAELKFPDMLGKCEGYPPGHMEGFRQSCIKYRKNNPQKVVGKQ
jgi:hypothetical protein